MSNPWLKKNPFMSMWLSGANQVVGSVHGQATAALKREAQQAGAAMTAAAAQQVTQFWTHKLGQASSFHPRTAGVSRVRAGTAGRTPTAPAKRKVAP